MITRVCAVQMARQIARALHLPPAAVAEMPKPKQTSKPGKKKKAA